MHDISSDSALEASQFGRNLSMNHFHCLTRLTLPLELYSLCQRAAFPIHTRSFTSGRQFQQLAKTACSRRLIHAPATHLVGYRLTAIKTIPSVVRRSASSSKAPVTFFDSNLKRRDPWNGKAQTDIEKSWLKAHLDSLPEKGGGLESPPSNEQESSASREERHARAVQANAQLTLDDEPPRYTSDNHGPSYRDLIIRCTTFDAEGNIQKHSEPVAKNALCAQHNLQPRDLRKIDSRIPNVIPTM